MAFKKVNKEFVLSDSSKNVYGFKLLTSGYMMNEYLKNPIGYYNHLKDDGILVKWEDVKLDGDNVLGYPSINLLHPRGERSATEIEEGFLNAASVGKLCIMEYHLEDDEENPGNSIVVVTKWYNKECSVVDNPGNRNAMKVELFDVHGNETNLEDLTENFKIKNSVMAKITIPVTPELLTLLNLGDDTTVEQVVNGIKELHTENATLKTDKNLLVADKAKLETDLSDLKAAADDEKVNAILDKGLEAGKFSKETKEKLAKQFKGKPEDLADVVDSMQAYTSIIDKIKDKDGAEIKLDDQTYDELDKANLMPMVKKNHPELYKKKFKEKFNKEPKM